MVTHQGENLSSIYEYILEQRLVWIKAPDSSFSDVVEGEVEIEEIKVKERG